MVIGEEGFDCGLGENGLDRVQYFGLIRYLEKSRFSVSGEQTSAYRQAARSLLRRRVNLTLGGVGDHYG